MSSPEAPLNELPGLDRPFPVSPAAARAAGAIREAGGCAVVVGGACRDHLLGAVPKDLDLEVYRLSLEALERALAEVGSVHAVGRSFGVLKVTVDTDGARESIDVALPRRESKRGRGHRGFVVESDPDMPFAEAAARRDFTLNALGWDLEAEAWLDPWGGVRDLERGVLRHVSPAFDEDPLRVLRACQLAARFQLRIAPETVERCRALEEELPTLARERLYEELRKLLLRARFPSIGLSALVETGAIRLFPELEALRGCPQEAEWHPEGDVWVHTLMVVDAAAMIVRRDQLDDDEAWRVLLGALCHDLGKPATTAFEDGRVRSRDHEAGGEAPTRSFLERVGVPPAVVDDVVALVREHLKPYQLFREREHVKDGALRRLALRVPLSRLVRVSEADFLGRTTPEALAGEDPSAAWLLAQAERLAVRDARPEPILLGRHLIARGLKPGPRFGDILSAAFAAQLDGDFADVAGAEAWLDAFLAERP